jgi:hypothetical protein
MRDLSDRELERLFELDDAPGPARPVDDARSAALVAGALAGAGFSPAGGGGDGGGGAHAGAKQVAAAGAANGSAIKLAVLAGGAAVVATVVAWFVMRAPREPAPVIASPAPAVIASNGSAIVRPEPGPTEVPTASTASTPAASAPEPVEVPPAMPEPNPPSTPRRPAPAKLTKPALAHPHRHPPVAAPPVVAAAPDDLLAEANAARVAHRWREADALYSRVAAGGQADLAVQAALVASASLRLEHLGDPAGAARRFRAALAAGPRDSLAEDARWGLVESARATADPAGELRALDDFLSHHAGSARAARARARREELGAPR